MTTVGVIRIRVIPVYGDMAMKAPMVVWPTLQHLKSGSTIIESNWTRCYGAKAWKRSGSMRPFSLVEVARSKRPPGCNDMRPAYALAEYCEGSPNSDGDNASLAGCAGSQDLTAFQDIVERLQGKIFSVSYALLGSFPEADVTAQKVFVRLYRTPRCAERQDIIQYAYRLAVDQCRIELRVRRVRRFFAWSTSSAPVPDRCRFAATHECRERGLALRYLAMLPRKERALLVLREVAGQSVEGIAQIMNMKPGAVRKHLFSARQRLLRIIPAADKQAR